MITELTKEQKDSIPGYVEERIADALAYKVLTQEAAVKIKADCYALLSKTEPEKVYRVMSPYHGIILYNILERIDAIIQDKDVIPGIVKDSSKGIDQADKEAIIKKTSQTIYDQCMDYVPGVVSRTTQYENVEGVSFGIIKYIVSNLNHKNISVVFPYITGYLDSHYFAWMDFMLGIGVTLEAKVMEQYTLYKNVSQYGYVFPFDNYCLVCEKPTVISRNTSGLHSEKGPAILYNDGFKVYALNGVRVPETVVMTPAEEMSKAWLIDNFAKQDNVEIRREISRKVGSELLCNRLGAKLIESKYGYDLISLDIDNGTYRPYLRMKNPSVEGVIHIEGVHPDCKTVNDALLYRNGLKENQIDDVNGVDWYQQGDVLLIPKGAKKIKRHPIILT